MQQDTAWGTRVESLPCSGPTAHHSSRHNLGSGDVTAPARGLSGSPMPFDIRHLHAPVLTVTQLGGHEMAVIAKSPVTWGGMGGY